MNFNKCQRCGCFFVTNSNVCPKCEPKDNAEIQTLKNYISDHLKADSIQTISADTGIQKRNIDRFMQYDEFSDLLNNKSKNLKMNL